MTAVFVCFTKVKLVPVSVFIDRKNDLRNLAFNRFHGMYI